MHENQLSVKISKECDSLCSTFQSKNPAIRIHQGRVRCDGPSQRLHWHIHINDNDTVLWGCFPDTYVLIGFHGNMCKCDELWTNPN